MFNSTTSPNILYFIITILKQVPSVNLYIYNSFQNLQTINSLFFNNLSLIHGTLYSLYPSVSENHIFSGLGKIKRKKQIQDKVKITLPCRKDKYQSLHTISDEERNHQPKRSIIVKLFLVSAKQITLVSVFPFVRSSKLVII